MVINTPFVQVHVVTCMFMLLHDIVFNKHLSPFIFDCARYYLGYKQNKSIVNIFVDYYVVMLYRTCDFCYEKQKIHYVVVFIKIE